MRKKIVLLLLAILLLSLVGVSARARWNTGNPYIPCYPFDISIIILKQQYHRPNSIF